jgi:hypothetical protein
MHYESTKLILSYLLNGWGKTICLTVLTFQGQYWVCRNWKT